MAGASAARAGLRVLALDHHGNDSVDGYEPEGFLHVWERPRDVSFALDELARERPLGPVGAAGFSLGAHTAVALAGTRLDTDVLWAVLSGDVPLPDIPEFPGVLEAYREKYPDDLSVRRAIDGAGADLSDARVRAVFQVAPGVGGFVTPGPGGSPGARGHPLGRCGHGQPVRGRHQALRGAHPHSERPLRRCPRPPRRLPRAGARRPGGPPPRRRGGGRLLRAAPARPR
ncbi:hypothetical protein OH779_35535 [Actinacidiphila glaucinigra]|uniref:hypothetical protein n=1 Tax=Actinacidiphila glaucinigra TaxID=235986 RepID=UPI003868F0FA